MAVVQVHVWKTNDGRMVLAEDPDAAILAYAPGDEVQAKDSEAVSALLKQDMSDKDDEGEPQPDVKQADKPADKAVKRGGDK